MAFDGLHVIWTTYKSWPPHDTRGNWSALRDLYTQIAAGGHYFELSKPLPQESPDATPADALVLTRRQQDVVIDALRKLISIGEDRIAGGLPVSCFAVGATSVQLVIIPSPTHHSQIIGRLKSKSASQALREPEPKDQSSVWARGYWFANINGAEALRKIEQFVRTECAS